MRFGYTAGCYAKTIHAGDYATLGDTWARFLGEWVASSGEQLGTGPSYERYVNTPMDALRTEICIPPAD